MPESKGKKVFRIQLTISVVVLLLTLSAFSLVAAFYLGMTTGISMQRPPESFVPDTNISEEKPPVLFLSHLNSTDVVLSFDNQSV